MKKQSLFFVCIVLSLAFVCCDAVAQNLIASYPLNGNVNDVSGNGLNGTIIGTPGFVADRFGNPNSAIEFPGHVDHRVEIDDNPLLHTPSITISAWVYITNMSSLQSFVDKPLGSSTSDSWHFGLVMSNGYYHFSCWLLNDPNNANPMSQITAQLLKTGEWHYVVSTFDNTTKQHKLYVDAVLKAVNTFNSTIGYDNNKMYLGAAIENGGLFFPMWGRLDDVKIYDAALTAQQIASDYNASVTYDNTGSGNAWSFTDQSTYIQLPSLLDGTNMFTLDFWVKTTSTAGGNVFWNMPTLVGNANPISPDGDFGITSNEGKIAIWSGISNTGDQNLQTTKYINDNKWHHVAAVSDGNTLVLYVDGILLPGSISTAGGVLQTSARPWRIGQNNSCCGINNSFDGMIDEFRVWNTPLSQEQIRERMCKKTISSDVLYNNLVAYYHFNEKMGGGIVDSKGSNAAELVNGTRVISGAPVGDGSAYDYVNATKTATISHASGESFTVTSTAGNPDGIQVYRVDEQPNSLNGTVNIGTMDKYFGVFQSGGTSPQYSAVYNYTGNAGVNASNESSLVLNKRTDNAVMNWVNGAAVLDMNANTLTLTGQSTEYILGSSGVLPLRLLSFTAIKQNAGVLLQWQTSNEINTSHFEIERSNDGVTFEKIGITNALQNSGTPDYHFTDNAPVKGINYYRLRLVDRDGRYTYSPVVKVIFNNDGAGLVVYPNPAGNTITMKYAANQKTVTLSIFDFAGRKVMSGEFNHQNSMQVNISALSKGLYTIKLTDGIKQMQAKLVKL